jgi:hypothetical protein
MARHLRSQLSHLEVVGVRKLGSRDLLQSPSNEPRVGVESATKTATSKSIIVPLRRDLVTMILIYDDPSVGAFGAVLCGV